LSSIAPGRAAMIVPDVNLLLYAYDAASPFHAAAARWWETCLSGDEAVGLAPVVVFAFLRLATSRRVFDDPMTPVEAAGHIRTWTAQPAVRILEAAVDHVERVCGLLESLGVGGNLVTDAQIAALVLESGAILHTTDTDFLRFEGLRWINPLTGMTDRKAR
jgi:toxin-antitoxin system PIN domain toxin